MKTLHAETNLLARRLIQERDMFDRELNRRGTLYECCGGARADGVTLSIASEFGGKQTNQDSCLLFIPSQPSSLKWIGATSDGVGSSVQSEAGSRLACHAALTSIARSYAEQETSWPAPISDTLAYFSRIGQSVAKQPELYQPSRMSNRFWKKVVQDARYAQATLMVAWEEEDGITIEGIGDGGFLLATKGACLPYLPSFSGPVNCVSPCGSFTAPDYRFEFQDWDSLALFTDGVTPVVTRDGCLQPKGDAEDLAAAEQTLDEFLTSSPDLIHDNVSLLLARRCVA